MNDKIMLKVDIWELETRNQGAQLQVFVVHKSSSETLVWDYVIEQDDSSYIGESHDIAVEADLLEVIIRIQTPQQTPETIVISATEIIENHFLSDSGL